ncbi:hypothetical protein [Caballeronia mineralivorans]|uniref:hypothetical protein n=1 Tax=Caballeronia mineralivorans TaxID=2010198 RepID=UPI00069E6ADC
MTERTWGIGSGIRGVVCRAATVSLVAVVAGYGLVLPAIAQETTPADAAQFATPQFTVPNFAMLVRRYGPAVVSISVTREVTQTGIQLPSGIAPGNPLAP